MPEAAAYLVAYFLGNIPRLRPVIAGDARSARICCLHMHTPATPDTNPNGELLLLIRAGDVACGGASAVRCWNGRDAMLLGLRTWRSPRAAGPQA